MSAEYPENSSSHSFELPEALLSLNKVVNDPFIERVVSDARALNEIFTIEHPETDEYQELVRQLDERLGSVIDSDVLISGRLSYRDDEGEIQAGYFEDIPAQMRGFCVRYTEQGIPQIRYNFLTTKERLGYLGLTEDDPDVGVWSDFDMVQIEYTDVSLERAIPLLQAVDADRLLELDMTILNNEEDEGAALVALKDVDLQVYIENEDSLVSKSLELYLVNILKFDRMCPYKLTISGVYSILGPDEERTSRVVNGLPFLVLPRSMEIHKLVPEAQEGSYKEVHLECILIPEDKEISATNISIPFSSIDELKSLRRAFYA